MDKNKAIESVNEIKELMERSSKFVSLSGMTAVLAGVYALAGAYVTGQLLRSGDNREGLIMVASLVLTVSVEMCIRDRYDTQWQYGREFRMHDFHFITENPWQEAEEVDVTFKIRHTPEFMKGKLVQEGGKDVYKRQISYMAKTPFNTNKNRIIINSI